jgi:hypothetical protein
MWIHVLLCLIIGLVKFWDGDSDVPTTSSHKQLGPFALVVTTDSETGTEEEERFAFTTACRTLEWHCL